ITQIKQHKDKATFAAIKAREQEKIDCTHSNTDVYNQIRGLNPWPVAFTTYENKNMKIWSAELEHQKYDGNPGEIVEKVNEKGFVVVCGNKKGVIITEIQPSGNKRMTVREYLLGSDDRIKIGIIMGERKSVV